MYIGNSGEVTLWRYDYRASVDECSQSDWMTVRYSQVRRTVSTIVPCVNVSSVISQYLQDTSIKQQLHNDLRTYLEVVIGWRTMTSSAN